MYYEKTIWHFLHDLPAQAHSGLIIFQDPNWVILFRTFVTKKRQKIWKSTLIINGFLPLFFILCLINFIVVAFYYKLLRLHVGTLTVNILGNLQPYHRRAKSMSHLRSLSKGQVTNLMNEWTRQSALCVNDVCFTLIAYNHF